MRPDIDLGRQLASELAGRGLNATKFAQECRVNARTMRSYVNGEFSIPPDVARELIVALDACGGFVHPAVRDALVIRGRGPDLRTPPNQIEPLDLRVDTVVLTLEVDESRRAAVAAFLAAQLPPKRKDRYRLEGRVQLGDGGASIIVSWDGEQRGKARRVRVQLAPWEPQHCRLLQRLLRCAALRSPGGLLAEGPVVRFARLDVAINYAAEPRWLLLHRPRASTYRMLESKDFQLTYYAGSRKGCDCLIRLYDHARHHKKPGPVARIEAELHFNPQISPVQLEDQKNPFRVVELGPLFCPELTFTQAALLHWAKDVGIRWAMKQLDQECPTDAAQLKVALQKAADSPLLEAPSEIMDRFQRYIPELLRTQLFWHEPTPGDLQPWSYPPVPADYDGADSLGPESSPIRAHPTPQVVA